MNHKSKNIQTGLLFCSPGLVSLAVFYVYPCLSSLALSFTHSDGVRPPRWIGTDNYAELFLRDPLFIKALANTLWFVSVSVPVTLLLSLALAMFLNQNVRGIGIYRAVCYVPTITPILATSILWMWLLNPEIGLVNTLLRSAGVAHPPSWLNDPLWSKPSIILMGLWGVGGGMVIFLAALQGVSKSLVEAAELDGAGPWQSFRHITVPAISPVVFFNLITGLIGGFQVFTEAYVLTNGGPEDSTLFYALHLFNRAFLEFDLGTASAMAWVLLLISLVAIGLVFGTSSRWVHYAGKS